MTQVRPFTDVEQERAAFAELGIPWHAGIGTGPGNHLLSSQVQCVNALGQMVTDADRLVPASPSRSTRGDRLERVVDGGVDG